MVKRIHVFFISVAFILGFFGCCYCQEDAYYTLPIMRVESEVDSIVNVKFGKMNLKETILYLNSKKIKMNFGGNFDKKGNVKGSLFEERITLNIK